MFTPSTYFGPLGTILFYAFVVAIVAGLLFSVTMAGLLVWLVLVLIVLLLIYFAGQRFKRRGTGG